MDTGGIRPAAYTQAGMPASMKKTEQSTNMGINTTDSFKTSEPLSSADDLKEAAKKLLEQKQPDFRPIWKTDLGKSPSGTPSVAQDGTIFTATEDGHVFAVEPNTGKTLWNFKAGDYIFYTSTELGPDGTIYAGSCDNKLYAIDPSNGSKKWDFDCGDKIKASPTVTKDGSIIVGNESGKIISIDPAKNQKNWEFNIGQGQVAKPLAPGDGKVYIAGGDGRLYALDEKNGKDIWKTQLCSDFNISRSSPIMGDDGTIYIGTMDAKALAINSQDGKIKWEHDIEKYTYSTPCLDAKNETVFVGSDNGKMHALDAKTGNEKWVFSTNPQDLRETGMFSNPLAAPDGNLYFGTSTGKFYALDASNGGKKWEYDAGSSVNSSATLAKDGTVYIGAANSLLAFNASKNIKDEASKIGSEKPQKPEEPGKDNDSEKPNKNPEIIKEDEFIIIDGVKIPVRKNNS